ncbi:alpha-protein kinase 3 [Aulostomus maculatus]
MTSRRPMTRSFSANGRTSSFSEDEGSSANGRSEIRNTYLSNVRPENSYSRYSHYRPTRSTLCSVMAQLTEDIQPSFETTLKSKAVSENCNVKFTCVVSGYPAPELKWYKDDMEMDRYCGLPKYEIHRNGKTHTLHIYNCTLDDAAIYQASASNSKGIVSCSGVLEVGTMNEFKIHQRFFAKLKQKADKKKKDLEAQNKKEDKENIQKQKPQVSPERPQRKRPIPQPEQIQAITEPEAVEQLGAAAEVNGVSAEVKETGPVPPSVPDKEIPPFEDTLAKKKIKIANGVDTAGSSSSSSSSSSSRSHMMGNGGENCYDGGISLAQFLAETLQSQVVEEKQNQFRVETPKEMDTTTAAAQPKQRSEVKHHKKDKDKDHDHHNIQTSISSMLHSVKDFFFGKGKKDSHDPMENKEKEFPGSMQSPQSQTPPSYRLQLKQHPEMNKSPFDEVVPMETEKQSANIEQKSLQTLRPHGDSPHIDMQPADQLPPESVEEQIDQVDAGEAMEVSVGPEVSGADEEKSLSELPVVKEAEEKDSQVVLELHTFETHCAKEEAECTSLTQEMNVGFPPTVATEMEKGFEDNLCNKVKEQEELSLVQRSAEADNESFKFEMETGKKFPAEQLDEEIQTEAQNKEGNCIVLDEPGNVAHQDEKQACLPSGKVPQIEISLRMADSTNLKPLAPDLIPNEHVAIPKINIMEPEIKEFTLPLTILALDKTESKQAIVKNHDATEVMIQDQQDSPGLLPIQKGMQNDSNLSSTGNVKEVVQLENKADTVEQEQISRRDSEQLPQMNSALIPTINVSCSDDREDEALRNTHVSDTLQPFETPAVPLFVVPPISVTCHESDYEPKELTQCEWTETKTSSDKQRGIKLNVNNKVTSKPEKAQNQEEIEDRTENPPSNLHETPKQKVDENVPSFNRAEDSIVPEIQKAKPLKEAKIENSVTVEDLLKSRSSVERLSFKPPAHPSLSPASLRKFMSKATPDSENDSVNERVEEDLSGGSTPTSSLSCESSPRLKRRDSLSLIRSATPEELASGARRKIFIPKTKEDGDVSAPDTQNKKETPYMSPSQARRAALLQAPMGQSTPPMERRSPLLSRRKATLEVPKFVEETPPEEPAKPPEKKLDPLKAPQVIRKIRGEPFPDASGHLKLWCQFFNVLSDSTIKWYRDEEEILEVKRSGGDESQVALAIVLASNQDCGVYGCSIKNEYGTDTTDFLLSADILSEILLKDDLEIGEEIEMTPLLFTKGLANSGNWGDKYFGRIMTEAVHVGEGSSHKSSRVKVIYGLNPVFESGSTCIMKVQNPIAYGTKQENNLAERNLAITKQECKVQNMIREYCKIFTAEARDIENFGSSLEVIPLYLMYRPANSVPYARVEADLEGNFFKYCVMDPKGKLLTESFSEIEQKCCTFQHWIHQWTHGNLLVTRLEGVEMKITNIRVVTKSPGYQGLTDSGSPEVFEQFLTQHQCNYYCGLLSLRPLKSSDTPQSSKMKGSRSPLLNRKLNSGSPQLQRKGTSPQLQRKGTSPQLQRKGTSPQVPRKTNSSPKVPRKAQETEDSESGNKLKPAETLDVLEMR